MAKNYWGLGITILLCFVLPEIIPPEISEGWHEAPQWKSALLFGTYQSENLLYVVMRAARITLSICLVSLLLSVVLGGILLYGCFSRWKKVFLKVATITVFFPRLFFVILFSAVLGLAQPSELSFSPYFYLVIALGGTGALFFMAQNAHELDNVSQQLFVQFSKSIETPNIIIFIRHIIPNCTGLPISIAKQLRDNIIFLSILTFVGLVHFQPEDLGGLIDRFYDSPDAFIQGWWILFFPCAFLCCLVLQFDLLGIALAERREIR